MTAKIMNIGKTSGMFTVLGERTNQVYEMNKLQIVVVIIFVVCLFLRFDLASISPSKNNILYRNIDYFIESATYAFLFTSRKTSENERVSAANE